MINVAPSIFKVLDSSSFSNHTLRSHKSDTPISATHLLDACANETGNTWKHAFDFIMTNEGLVYLEPQTNAVWWLPDHKEIEPGMTFRYEGFPNGDTDLVAVTDVDIIVEG